MRRPWQIWTVYIASLALVIAGVVWLSLRALESERIETAARKQAALEENTRLALWRMDSAKAPLVSDESARPYFAYMTIYPAERAYGRVFNKGAAASPMLLSPLAVAPHSEVRVHFQFDAEGRLTSPQVPQGPARDETVPRFINKESMAIAEQSLDRVRDLVQPGELLAQLPPVEAAPTELQFSISPGGQVEGDVSVNSADRQLPTGNASRNARRNAQGSPAQQQGYYGIPSAGYGSLPQVAEPSQQPMENTSPDDGKSAVAQQRARGDNEFQARSQYLTNSVNSSASRSGNYNGDFAPLVVGGERDEPAADARLSRMVPQWIGGELILARRVNLNGREFVQGCLLDWPAIRAGLLADIGDLLPNADLVPLTMPPEDGLSRLLASLPVRLLPGDVTDGESSGLSPTQQSLLIAWAAMLAGALAVAALLQGVIALSERRAAFVSAVTHELRTPLTTFRMYAEMLAEGMVEDEANRRRYLQTLRLEADRLTHLVENVLAYARLERGRPEGRIGPISVATMLQHGDRLSERALQSGLELLIDADQRTQSARALADASAVEQILFNLVDNACKYASTGNHSLHLEADADDRYVRLRVRDHGRGISHQDRARLFQPFRKSADDAARSAPGVGLGLALSRRLARQMGGELSYETNGEPGASFVLRLRRAEGNAEGRVMSDE